MEIQRQRAMRHEVSACVKGCLDDVWPVTALTEISVYFLPWITTISVTIHNLQMVHVWVHLAYCHIFMYTLKAAEKSDN
jgi:hypothetical protein